MRKGISFVGPSLTAAFLASLLVARAAAATDKVTALDIDIVRPTVVSGGVEWKIRVLQKHPMQMSVRHFVPPAFVAGLVGLALLSPWLGAAGWLLGILLAVYLTAIAAATAGVSTSRCCGRTTTTMSARSPMSFSAISPTSASG